MKRRHSLSTNSTRKPLTQNWPRLLKKFHYWRLHSHPLRTCSLMFQTIKRKSLIKSRILKSLLSLRLLNRCLWLCPWKKHRHRLLYQIQKNRQGHISDLRWTKICRIRTQKVLTGIKHLILAHLNQTEVTKNVHHFPNLHLQVNETSLVKVCNW